MLNSTAIKNNLKKNDINQIDSTIEASTTTGMISMDQYAKKLIDKGAINAKDLEWILKKNKPTKNPDFIFYYLADARDL